METLERVKGKKDTPNCKEQENKARKQKRKVTASNSYAQIVIQKSTAFHSDIRQQIQNIATNEKRNNPMVPWVPFRPALVGSADRLFVGESSFRIIVTKSDVRKLVCFPVGFRLILSSEIVVAFTNGERDGRQAAQRKKIGKQPKQAKDHGQQNEGCKEWTDNQVHFFPCST